METTQLLKKWFCISILVLSCSCNKYIKDDYPDETYCEKYAGLYDMYDPEEDIHYDMNISCSHGVIFGSTQWDSIHFENFANKFEISYGIGSNSFTGTLVNPLLDDEGHSWNFGNIYFPDTLNRINVYLNDSIYLYYQIDNTAYWPTEGVPYQNVTTVHSGRKIH
ncbi:MAG: hypothetical protein ACI857_000226 [Arenicella sp.]|jgi:hypothetical protein